jgi:DNA-binding transcriptional regulator YiaG
MNQRNIVICGKGMQLIQSKVKELRKKNGWSQEDLARLIEVSLSTVQRWEGKGAKPTRHARKELARLFLENGIADK